MTDLSPAINDAVRALHAAPQKVVLEYAGAGSQAISWLHSLGGSSQTVLEATDRYSASAVDSVLGFSPSQYVCAEVAQLLANKAYLRAESLEPSAPLIGLGCTATIATNRNKQGQHRCFVSWQDGKSLNSYSLVMGKGVRSREQEETLVSTLILKALTVAFDAGDFKLSLDHQDTISFYQDKHDLWHWLANQPVGFMAGHPNGPITAGGQLANAALLCGSFNPLHEGHTQLANVASKTCGRRVDFEISLTNADKPPLSTQDAHQRLAQFRGKGIVLFTKAAMFHDKAKVFPNSVFVVGADTAERLVHPCFYSDDPNLMRMALKEIQRSGCRFLVAGRRKGAKFITLDDLDLPKEFSCLFEKIPESDFRNDVSSTDIREG